MTPKGTRAGLLRRWRERTEVDLQTGCWNWKGTMIKCGYGQITLNQKRIPTHRLAWEIYNGPIPEGLEIHHCCRNKACCSPAHLELVTHKENGNKGDSPGNKWGLRSHCGRGHPYTPGSYRLTKEGYRDCYVCRRPVWKRQAERRKAERHAALESKKKDAAERIAKFLGDKGDDEG